MLADYLQVIEPDYKGEIIELSPHETLTVSGGYTQISHMSDSGKIYVTTLSDQCVYFITCKWNQISESDRDILLDCYSNPDKAMGRAKTFQFRHPSDNVVYVVRFESEYQDSENTNGRYTLPSVVFRVEGKVY